MSASPQPLPAPGSLGHEGEEDGAAEAQPGGHCALAVLEQREAEVLLDGGDKALAGLEQGAAVFQQDLQQLQSKHLGDMWEEQRIGAP